MTVSSNKLLTLCRCSIRSRRALIASSRCQTRVASTHSFRLGATVFNKPHCKAEPRLFSSLSVEDTSEPPRKTIPFILADIGEGIAEVELLQWYVSPGDDVAQFDRVCEVQSDKATVEITSRFDGIVESLNGKVGDMIQVGSPLIQIGVVDVCGGTAEPAEGGSNETQQPGGSSKLHNIDDQEDKLRIPSLASSYDLAGDENEDPKRGKVFATPAVRKLGMDHNLSLSNIVGTGPKGRVLKADVLKIIQEKEGKQSPGSSAPTTTGGTALHSHGPLIEEDTTVDVKGYNRMMIKSMTTSLQVPHMHYGDEIDMGEMIKCKKALQAHADAHGVKLSLLPFAIKAVSLALKDYPALNASLNAEGYKVTYKASHNIGVAMDTPRGLAVPVIKNCQNLSVLEIAAELSRLRNLGMESSLSERDISDATFSISNMGAIGGTYMSPVVVPPQVAIGAMGRIQRLPRFVDNAVEEVSIMQISWGGDHRVIDGATMARFSNRWKEFMENPISMVVSLR